MDSANHRFKSWCKLSNFLVPWFPQLYSGKVLSGSDLVYTKNSELARHCQFLFWLQTPLETFLSLSYLTSRRDRLPPNAPTFLKISFCHCPLCSGLSDPCLSGPFVESSFSACLLNVGGSPGADLSPLLSWWGIPSRGASSSPWMQPPPYSLVPSELQACISSFQEVCKHLEPDGLNHQTFTCHSKLLPGSTL